MQSLGPIKEISVHFTHFHLSIQGDSAMQGAKVIEVSTDVTPHKFMNNVMGYLVTKLSRRTQTMQTRLEDRKRRGFFPCSFSAESCTIFSMALVCKINQRELEHTIC